MKNIDHFRLYMKHILPNKHDGACLAKERQMFDSIVLAKIMEMQNAADRRRWKADEDAFYRDFGNPFGDRCARFWRRVTGSPAEARATGSSPDVRHGCSACGDGRDQAARR